MTPKNSQSFHSQLYIILMMLRDWLIPFGNLSTIYYLVSEPNYYSYPLIFIANQLVYRPPSPIIENII